MEGRCAVAAQQVAEHIQFHRTQIAQAGRGKSDAQINLVPGAAAHFHTRAARRVSEIQRRRYGQIPAVLQVAEKLSGMGEHRLRLNVAGHQQEHIAGLIPAFDVIAQVLGGDGPDGVRIADDGATVGRIPESGRLKIFIELAHGRILAALQLGNDHVFLCLQLPGVQPGLKCHLLDHIHAHAPVGGGHVCHVPGLVKAGGRVEVAPQRFHVAGHLSFGPMFRAFENHVFQQMADARLARRFIGRARAHIQTGADQGKARVPDDIHGESVGQPDQTPGGGNVPRGRCCRSRRGAYNCEQRQYEQEKNRSHENSR